MGLNYIYSYREDYISKVNVLLEIRKKKTTRDILSILANLIYFLVYYVIVIACFVGIIFLRKRNVFEELKTLTLNVNTAGSFATMLVLLFVFANLVFLLALTLFNNTNLAISFSLLYFIGGEVIANMIKSRFSVPAERVDNSVLTIFTKSFNLLNQNITFSLGNFLPLVLNMLGLIVVIVIVRLMKKIIG
ncbi:iron ABC transporter permease [Gemella haemolysans]|nr:iron ABC transporter permease [Gemella haemolysans]